MAKKQKKTREIFNLLYLLIMLVYFIVFLKIVMFKNGITNEFRGLNLIPFLSFKEYFNGDMSLDLFLKNVLGNIGIFIPMGIFISKANRSSRLGTASSSVFIISFTIELCQYITGLGFTDIDDLIFNSLGGFLGSLIYIKVLRKIDLRKKKPIGSVAFLTIFGLVGLINVYIFQPNLLPRDNVEYLNKEVLGDLEVNEYDYTGEILYIYDNIIDLNLFVPTDNKQIEKEKKSFLLEDADLFLSIKNIEYNSKGMVENTIIGFESIDLDELKSYVERNQNKIDIWADEDSVKTLILKITE